MRISDWSSDVCSSDLRIKDLRVDHLTVAVERRRREDHVELAVRVAVRVLDGLDLAERKHLGLVHQSSFARARMRSRSDVMSPWLARSSARACSAEPADLTSSPAVRRSEEHTSELQSLMRISYAV